MGKTEKFKSKNQNFLPSNYGNEDELEIEVTSNKCFRTFTFNEISNGTKNEGTWFESLLFCSAIRMSLQNEENEQTTANSRSPGTKIVSFNSTLATIRSDDETKKIKNSFLNKSDISKGCWVGLKIYKERKNNKQSGNENSSLFNSAKSENNEPSKKTIKNMFWTDETVNWIKLEQIVSNLANPETQPNNVNSPQELCAKMSPTGLSTDECNTRLSNKNLQCFVCTVDAIKSEISQNTNSNSNNGTNNETINNTTSDTVNETNGENRNETSEVQIKKSLLQKSMYEEQMIRGSGTNACSIGNAIIYFEKKKQNKLTEYEKKYFSKCFNSKNYTNMAYGRDTVMPGKILLTAKNSDSFANSNGESTTKVSVSDVHEERRLLYDESNEELNRVRDNPDMMTITSFMNSYPTAADNHVKYKNLGDELKLDNSYQYYLDTNKSSDQNIINESVGMAPVSVIDQINNSSALESQNGKLNGLTSISTRSNIENGILRKNIGGNVHLLNDRVDGGISLTARERKEDANILAMRALASENEITENTGTNLESEEINDAFIENDQTVSTEQVNNNLKKDLQTTTSALQTILSKSQTRQTSPDSTSENPITNFSTLSSTTSTTQQPASDLSSDKKSKFLQRMPRTPLTNTEAQKTISNESNNENKLQTTSGRILDLLQFLEPVTDTLREELYRIELEKQQQVETTTTTTLQPSTSSETSSSSNVVLIILLVTVGNIILVFGIFLCIRYYNKNRTDEKNDEVMFDRDIPHEVAY